MKLGQKILESSFILWQTTQQIINYLWDLILKSLPYLYSVFMLGVPYIRAAICWGFPPILYYSLFYLWKFIQYAWDKIIMTTQLLDSKYMYGNGIGRKINQFIKTEIELKPMDVRKSNEILKDVVTDRIIDCMLVKDGDFEDLFEDILGSGSFFKDLKVHKADEYDLCLQIDLSRSVDSHLIEVQQDENKPSFVKIKIHETEFKDNEQFWHEILNENHYMDQNKFRQWFEKKLIRALMTMSRERFQPEGYVVKHHHYIYIINVRPKGPAFTLKIERKNDGRKISVDLVPCLPFRDYNLAGYRPNTDKTWIAIPKPLKPGTAVRDKELLWRTCFYKDEQRLIDKPIKPVIKLIKKLRDAHKWVHLKSYFIEILFLHELDDPLFRFYYPRVSKLAVFMYMLRKLQKKLEKEELLDFWHKDFNLLDKTNSHSLVKTAKELKDIIRRIDEDIIDDNEIIFKIFDRTFTDIKPRKDYKYHIFFIVMAYIAIHERFFKSIADNIHK